MNGIGARPRVKVSADGHGLVSHAGVGMLRELADLTGLSAQVTAALADTYKGPWIHAPGDAFADLAIAVADGADCVDGVGRLLGDREQAFGPGQKVPRLILRKERPHPGAQLRFTDADGHRITGFVTDTGHGVTPRPARRTRTAAPPARPR